MPPPARLAVLPSSVVPPTVSLPWLLSTPPPEPAAPVAVLREIVEPLTVVVPSE